MTSFVLLRQFRFGMGFVARAPENLPCGTLGGRDNTQTTARRLRYRRARTAATRALRMWSTAVLVYVLRVDSAFIFFNDRVQVATLQECCRPRSMVGRCKLQQSSPMRQAGTQQDAMTPTSQGWQQQ